MSAERTYPLTYAQICDIIPHRYPFLFIDSVTNFSDAQWIEGFKNVTANEPFFPGHFPGRPIMPGVIILEALAQLGAIFAKMSTGGVPPEKLIVFSGAESVRFRRPVLPGDVLKMRMELIRAKFGHWKMQGIATVGEEKAAEAILMATEI